MNTLAAASLRLAVGLLAAATVVPTPAQVTATAQVLAKANQALQAGQADVALAQIGALPQAGANVAEAQNISCRVHFALQQWDAAICECRRAVNLDGQNSADHMWLGRALGEKAGRTSFLSAYSLAKQVRSEFEIAVRLNPRSAEALTDLGEFYQGAPGVIGGGLDKAEGVAAQLDKVDAASASQLRAHIAEAHNDYVTAELELKQALAAAPHPALVWTSLASFYRHRKRWDEMESAVKSAESAASRDKHAAVALYDGAGILIETNRDPEIAARMLESYLASQNKTEEAPAFEAHLRLARLKKQMGDVAGAKRELAAALELAHDYKPALDFRI